MPVSVLMCREVPPAQKKIADKLSRKMSKTNTPEIVPENKMVKLADDDDDTVTITYTLSVKKDKIEDDETNPLWREACWAALLAMKNLDDEVVIRPGAHLNESLKDFGNTDCQTVNTCFVAEALTQAMLSKKFKEIMANQTK